MAYALNILIAVCGIGLLMIVHEGGHYLAARWAKMRVLKFSIGFGPVLYRKQPRGSSTVFQVGLIPFLAYVQVAGMNPYEEVDPEDDALFGKKSVLARIMVIGAGPIANYLAASLIVFVIALVGMPEGRPATSTVASVMQGSAAAEAGVRPGDTIVEAEGRAIHDIEQLQRVTWPRAGQATHYTLLRDGQRVPVVITPRPGPGGHALIGIAAQPAPRVLVRHPVGEAVRLALVIPAEMTANQIAGLADMVRRRTTENLGSVVQITDQVARAAERGPAEYFLFLALLSSALAFFNLLPFPALDGGRLIFLGYEVVARRKVNEKFEAVVHTAGLLFLLALMVFVTYRDISKAVSGDDGHAPATAPAHAPREPRPR